MIFTILSKAKITPFSHKEKSRNNLIRTVFAGLPGARRL